jgi:hypothetical protein
VSKSDKTESFVTDRDEKKFSPDVKRRRISASLSPKVTSFSDSEQTKQSKSPITKILIIKEPSSMETKSSKDQARRSNETIKSENSSSSIQSDSETKEKNLQEKIESSETASQKEHDNNNNNNSNKKKKRQLSKSFSEKDFGDRHVTVKDKNTEKNTDKEKTKVLSRIQICHFLTFFFCAFLFPS